MGNSSKENKLNELSPAEWLKFTKTWFVHNPKPRKKNELLHPAKFPEDLIEEFIRFFTKAGEVVLDPFLGTGSTLVACDHSNRRGIGIELQEKYVDIARQRVSASQQVICGNSAEIEKYNLPEVDFIITSPPYGPMLNKKGLASKERTKKGLDVNYSTETEDLGNAESYDEFLNRLVSIMVNLKPKLKNNRYAVVILQNYMDQGEYRTLAWDVARELRPHYQLRGERIWCFHPDTLIWTKEGAKRIENIKINDYVLTHQGVFGRVMKTFSRPYDGNLLKIIVRGLNKEIKCTPDHKILSIPRKYWPHSNAFQPFEQVSSQSPTWIKSGELKAGDILLLPIPKIKEKEPTIDLTTFSSKKLSFHKGLFTTKNSGGQTYLPRWVSLSPEFCRLAGYYISEGHGSPKVALSISSYDEKMRRDFAFCFKKVFPGIHLNVTKKEVVCYSRLLSEIFSKMFGSHAKDKHIPPFLLTAKPIYLQSLLKGLWAGDGHISNNRAAYKTISKKLADDMVFILLRLRLLPNIQFSEKYGIQLAFRGKSISELADLLDRRDVYVKRTKFNNQSWKGKDYFYLPIRKIEQQRYNGLVHNLMIEPHNSYVTYSFSSHNCQDNKTLYPYGYRYSFVPNVHHHYCLIFRKDI